MICRRRASDVRLPQHLRGNNLPLKIKKRICRACARMYSRRRSCFKRRTQKLNCAARVTKWIRQRRLHNTRHRDEAAEKDESERESLPPGPFGVGHMRQGRRSAAPEYFLSRLCSIPSSRDAILWYTGPLRFGNKYFAYIPKQKA